MATLINSDGVTTDGLKIQSPNVPTETTSPGTLGELAWDLDFIYICIAPNLWARTNISIHW